MLAGKRGFAPTESVLKTNNCLQVDCKKGPDSDKEGFAALVQELSAAFKPKGLLLSSAVSPSKVVIDAGYDVPRLSRYFDWIAVMTYDYHGNWDKQTGHVAPLYYYPDDVYDYFNAVSTNVIAIGLLCRIILVCKNKLFPLHLIVHEYGRSDVF